MLPTIIIISALTAMALSLGVIVLRLKSQQKRTALYKAVFDSSHEAVLVTDPDTVILDVNDAFCHITGYRRQEVIGRKPGMMSSGRHDKAFFDEMWKSIGKTGSWEGEIWDKRKNGDPYPNWLIIKSLKNRRGAVKMYIGVFSDTSALKDSSEQIDYLLEHDQLTGLPNRSLFATLANHALAHSKAMGKAAALLCVDIVGFGHVNESFGYSSGDVILENTANRIRASVPDGSPITRIGSDKFHVLLVGLGSHDEAALVAKGILESMHNVFILRNQHVHINANVGISMFPSDGKKLDELETRAEKALQEAKEKGAGIYQFFHSDTDEKATEILRVETNLRVALESSEFVLMYQPQVDLRSGRVTGAEALIRRQEPDWLVPPSYFIDVAESSGIIVDICEWTLEEACKQHIKWVKEGLPPIRVAVNFTSLQFLQRRAVPKVREALKKFKIAPEYLEIEVTERTIMHGSDQFISELGELKAMGVKLAIDDFGTGYSSLGYLTSFPVDTIKVDLSFVQEMTKSPKHAKIVKTIIDLSHNLGFRALAEGVETPEQLELVRSFDCDEMQGFYFSKPITPERFSELIRSGRTL